ncbi:MAG TPA: MATE family efflux transporter [Candidatus Angelobacter sp.]|jgi:MATE family multidrug resistance protein|nr:MATE family efflux transporter [Candidatus Angelobacter sp.]
MLRLAVPLALSELGWLAMNFVDTIAVGHLPNSAIAIGAVSVGTILFYCIAIFGSNLLLGLDTMVSQAFGAGRIEECHRNLFHAIYLTLALSPPMIILILVSLPLLHRMGMDPLVVQATIPFVKALTWSTLPLALYFALRRYLQAMGIVKPVVFTLVSANVVNLLGNWVFVYGHLGFRSFGVTGSGWSTFVSRIYMVVLLAGAVVYYDHKRSSGLWRASRRIEIARLRELLRLGLPAAVQFLLEISAFTAATVLVARLGALPLSGHQIALNVAGLTFMIPLGISSAAAVRVGHAIGANDFPGAIRSGWMAILFAIAFECCSALILLSFPTMIARIYTSDLLVIHAGAVLLLVAGAFQLFDGLQVTIAGALRGAGNTRTPMVVHLFGYWIIGLPIGAMLCFKTGWGAIGLWTGLCVGLILIGCILVFSWMRMIKQLASTNPSLGFVSAATETFLNR